MVWGLEAGGGKGVVFLPTPFINHEERPSEETRHGFTTATTNHEKQILDLVCSMSVLPLPLLT